ncbi:PREDICTED: uncharacterized protein LOC105456063 isoform X2 [Wasmannia auropunctata]|uniref:uncharacterized protein LOC105456063 isoform X2 n=1 Tax=Wasmannia auropunctata TaxID=64793 RepID=UPI0005EF3B0A|nr:PREDICTED: uncharacterized protein LOC105456063 isoform X2 [Wasmannia auropunctata]
MAQPGVRDIEVYRDIEGSRVNQVIRDPIQTEEEGVARYIMPEYACLMELELRSNESASSTLMDIDIVVTSICWTLKWRPEDVPFYSQLLTKEQFCTPARCILSPIASDHILMFIGMAGLMTMAKKINNIGYRNSNHDYLLFQWRVLCATTNMANIFEKTDYNMQMSIFRAIVTWQDWIKTKTKLRRTLLNLVLEEDNKREAVVVEMIEQVKMILKNFDLQSVQIMETFPMTGSSAILLPAIANQAVELKKAVLALKALHKERYPYIRLFPLEGVDRLHYRNYPDLYFAAVSLTTKDKDLGEEGRYQMSEIPTTIPKAIIIERVSQRTEIQPHLEEILEDLEYLGLDLTHLRVPTRQRREMEDEDEGREVKDEDERRKVKDEDEEREVEPGA